MEQLGDEVEVGRCSLVPCDTEMVDCDGGAYSTDLVLVSTCAIAFGEE